MSVDQLGFSPTEIVPPGETLLEWLDQRGMSQAEFAKRASLTPKHINKVVKGLAGISPEVAVTLESVTGIPARYWMRLDGNYQAAKQHLEFRRSLMPEADIVDLFPIKRLRQIGALPASDDKVGTLVDLLQFFGVADVEALDRVWLKPAMLRSSKAFEPSLGSLAAWLRLAEIEGAAALTESFDASACRAALPEIRSLSRLPGIEWLEPLRERCAQVGIALVIKQELPGCHVNGATRWLSSEKALVAMSFRHLRNDIFWFTLFHEICHVLKHSKKEMFVHVANSQVAQALEDEANTFAANHLIPPEDAHMLKHLKTADAVADFALQVGVAPGIVVGRMQHDGLIPYNRWTKLFGRYRFPTD